MAKDLSRKESTYYGGFRDRYFNGASLSEVLPHSHLDTDDYFWTTKFTKQREVPERKRLLEQDLSLTENWILSGAVCGWGDNLKSYFIIAAHLRMG